MSWTRPGPRYRVRGRAFALDAPASTANARCYVRKNHYCGKLYGASKSCFIACPDESELNPLLELVAEKLAKEGIETVVAVKERAYGQDIFCTKICGRIIESRFCLIVLDDTPSNGTAVPNPNVYYEYGLMTAMSKYVIPLQKEGLTLAFNIQSHDTIKYTSGNLPSELSRALKDAISLTAPEASEQPREHSSEQRLLRSLEMAGFDLKDDRWFLSSVIGDTDYLGFGHEEGGFYAYVGKVDDAADVAACLEELPIVIYRTEKAHRSLVSESEKAHKELLRLQEEKKKARVFVEEYYLQQATATSASAGSKLRKMGRIYLAFLVGPEVDAASLRQSVNTAIRSHTRYAASFSERDRLDFDGRVVALTGLSATS